MLVEAFRLLFTLMTTAVGFLIGKSWPNIFPNSEFDADVVIVSGALIGAGVGYVLGGVLGRSVQNGLDRLPTVLGRASSAQMFAGAVGVVTGIIVGVAASLPAIVFLPTALGWTVATLFVFVSAVSGVRLFADRADFFESGSSRATSTATPPVNLALIDSSAAIDGRVVELARSGLLGSEIWVPSFVVDEIQGIADAGERTRRRRGRRGLDVLEALQDIPSVTFRVSDDSVPEVVEVDAKLLTLALRLDAKLITTDHNLAKAGELRGVHIVNPHALGEALRPGVASGDIVTVVVEKVGSEPDQGVGFLEDGTMVVISDAAHLTGSTVAVEVSNVLRTSVGRMVFARLDS